MPLHVYTHIHLVYVSADKEPNRLNNRTQAMDHVTVTQGLTGVQMKTESNNSKAGVHESEQHGSIIWLYG